MWEHTFVTSQGSLHGQLQRAIERGNVLQATALARQLADELGGLSLPDALSLLLLFAEHDPDRFRRAAPRWHARLVLETGDLSLEEAQAALGALALLPGPLRPAALELLTSVCREHKITL